MTSYPPLPTKYIYNNYNMIMQEDKLNPYLLRHNEIIEVQVVKLFISNNLFIEFQ
jgi:hypothetical protein